jgi:hypothetical protein
MSRPSARTASQTSRNFLPVASPASISGQIHATRPVLVAGSTPGRARRCARSDFVLFRERKVGSTGVARIRPIHIRAQDRLFGQKSVSATVRNELKTVCNNGADFTRVATECNSLQPECSQKHSRKRVVEHKGIVERAGVFSLATSARSAGSVVGQNSPCVRPMFDAEFRRRICPKMLF